MKKAFVVFGLQLLAVASFGATVNADVNKNEIEFDLCGPKGPVQSNATRDQIIAQTCERARFEYSGISEIGISSDVSTRVEFTAYARLPMADKQSPIVASANFKIVFDNPRQASGFVALVKSGRVSKIVGLGRYYPIDAVTYSLGPVKLKAKDVFVYGAN